MLRLKSIVLPAARIAAITILVGGILSITRQMVSLSTETSGLLRSLANQATPQATLATLPTDAEVKRLHEVSDQIDVIADNLANIKTVAFKACRVDFNNTSASLQRDMTQGSLVSTGINLDAAIIGEGFFKVKISPAIADGCGYTRNGAFFLNKTGDLVTGPGTGYSLVPNINVPNGATNISIAEDGTVAFVPKGGMKVVAAGQILLSRFVNTQAWNSLGDGVFTETDASGPALIAEPGESGAGQLNQGFLEQSNVNPAKQWAAMLKAQQLLQLTNESNRVADQARELVASLTK